MMQGLFVGVSDKGKPVSHFPMCFHHEGGEGMPARMGRVFGVLPSVDFNLWIIKANGIQNGIEYQLVFPLR